MYPCFLIGNAPTMFRRLWKNVKTTFVILIMERGISVKRRMGTSYWILLPVTEERSITKRLSMRWPNRAMMGILLRNIACQCCVITKYVALMKSTRQHAEGYNI